MPRIERSPGLWRWILPACLALSCAASGPDRPRTVWEGGRALVELSYRGDALAIDAVGDFNDWNPGRDSFINRGDGLWTCSLSLAPGRYTYLLAVETDSEWNWQVDPANPERARDGKGRELSLLLIGTDQAGDSGAP
jgi:hypothetical protein